jgi:hypothetical protein
VLGRQIQQNAEKAQLSDSGVHGSPVDVRAVTLVPHYRSDNWISLRKNNEQGGVYAGERIDGTDQRQKGSLERSFRPTCAKVFQGIQFISDGTGAVR